MALKFMEFQRNFLAAPNDNARAASLVDLTSVYRNTKDKLVGNFLAKLVSSKSHSRDIRLCAYCALFEVAQRSLDDLPPLDQFKIPEDLDVVFLKYYLVREEKPE